MFDSRFVSGSRGESKNKGAALGKWFVSLFTLLEFVRELLFNPAAEQIGQARNMVVNLVILSLLIEKVLGLGRTEIESRIKAELQE